MDAAARRYIGEIPSVHRLLFDRFHRLVVEVCPDADVAIAYKMPTFRVGQRSLHVGVWKHGLSIYGWREDADGGFVQRHPELSSGRGTLRIRPGDAATISDDELRDLIRGALLAP